MDFALECTRIAALSQRCGPMNRQNLSGIAQQLELRKQGSPHPGKSHFLQRGFFLWAREAAEVVRNEVAFSI